MKIKDLEINEFAPVIIPTLCRDKHLIALLESLSKCKYAHETEVYVSIDFPSKKSHESGYCKICKFLDNCGDMTFKKLHVIKRTKNLGFGYHGNAQTTIRAVLENHNRFIFSEDDNIFAPTFLEFINYNLEKYKDCKEILSVQGYFYPINDFHSNNLILKLDHFSAWGYGLWKDRYEYLQEFSNLLVKREDIIASKDFKNYCLKYRPNIYTDMVGMVKGNPIWGDALYSAIQIRYNKRSIFPSYSLVRNTGWDGSGTHGGKNTMLLSQKVNNSNTIDNYLEATQKQNDEYNISVYAYFKQKIPMHQHILTSLTAKLYCFAGIYYNFNGFRNFWKKYIRR